jgi:hypothetical protein
VDISEVLTAYLVMSGYMHRWASIRLWPNFPEHKGQSNISYAGNLMGLKGITVGDALKHSSILHI